MGAQEWLSSPGRQKPACLSVPPGARMGRFCALLGKAKVRKSSQEPPPWLQQPPVDSLPLAMTSASSLVGLGASVRPRSLPLFADS